MGTKDKTLTRRTRAAGSGKPGRPVKLELRPGGFYKARNGAIWCCYRVDLQRDARGMAHSAAKCIDVATYVRPQVEYFYLDGRYDVEGKREHTLIEEVEAP